MGITKCDEYLERLRAQKATIYINGKQIDCPMDDPGLFRVAMGFGSVRDVLFGDDWKEKTVVKSSLINEPISLWQDLYTGPEPYIAKLKVMRQLCRRYFCVTECAFSDYINGLHAATYEIDQAYGTEYHKRHLEWVKYLQKEHPMLVLGILDAKGDRRKPPSKQAEPDTYVHVVKKRKDGIVVRGTKCNTSGGPIGNEIIVAPCRTDYTKEDSDFAVAFAIPVSTPGLKMICRSCGGMPARIPDMDHPISKNFLWTDAVTIFDDVFVPWERVFMCGEWDFVPQMVEYPLFRSHMWAKSGCKAGAMDLIIGMASLIAEYNGADAFDHVMKRIADMVITGNTCYSCGIAAAVEGSMHPSGVWLCDPMISTIPKYLAYQSIGKDLDWLMEIAGGLTLTQPTEVEWKNPEERALLEKVLVGRDGVPAEHRIRAMKLVEDYSCTELGAVLRSMSVIAGGPAMWSIEAALKHYDFEDSILTAKVFAGIEPVDKMGFVWG